ncbi:hypothetical protein GGR51DRAFT_539188 [Nemania sp. FL0031]|nr:hypothetical protein GGR51DRAFT_539188 [Nemania sp. FL0031]
MVPFRHRKAFIYHDSPLYTCIGDAENAVDSLTLPSPNCDFFDQRYAQSPTTEPLSEDMVQLVRSQLATMFYERMAFGFLFTEDLRLRWREDGMMRRFNQPCLPPDFFAAPSSYIRKHLLEYADVHVAIYFNWFGDPYEAGNGWVDRKLGRYIFRKWFHWYAGRPPFLGYQRLSKGLALKGREFRDIQNIRKFHRSLCDAVSTGLDQQALSEPSPSTDCSLTYKGQGREIAHLFRAIVIIVDDQVMHDEEPEIYQPVLPPELGKVDLLGYLEKERARYVSQFSVLLFRTGDDAHLSSPVSFQSLYDSGKALAVNRPDFDEVSSDDSTNVARVRIDTALEFVLGLIHREREAIPQVGLAAETEDRQHSEVCEKWIDGVMAHARKVGIDANGFTWEAVRRAKAALNGEAFTKYQVDPPWDHIGSTSLPLGVQWGVD